VSLNSRALTVGEILSPLPALSAASQDSKVILSWPIWPRPLSLYSATNPSAPVNWSLVTNVPVARDGSYSLELPNSGQSCFYQLQPH
jgi:hypothetical protein